MKASEIRSVIHGVGFSSDDFTDDELFEAVRRLGMEGFIAKVEEVADRTATEVFGEMAESIAKRLSTV